MKAHWGFLILVAIAFYFIGAWMPGPARKVYSAVGMG
jgi:hypothetical protein